MTRGSRTPLWMRALSRLLPIRYRAEILDDLLDERDDQIGHGRSRLASALWLASHLLRSITASRRLPADVTVAPHATRRVLFGGLWQDLRYAVRMLRKQRLLGAAAMLTLALGIGANSAIFALVDAILLRPLPYPEADRLVMLWERTPASPRGRVAPLNLYDWQKRSRSFEGMAAFVPNVGGMVMSGVGEIAETVPRQWVSVSIFDVLGVKAIAGRTFVPSDLRARAAVVVLNESFWRARFNADPAIVGRTIRFDGDPHTVVGIVPREAEVIGRASIWALAFNRFPEVPAPALRSAYLAHAIGRLKPGVTPEAASADLAAVSAALAQEFPKTNAGRGVTVDRLTDAVIGSELRQTSTLFLGVVGFVLLMCCANMANLLLTHATGRRRELAMRSALGAARSRVVRQLLTESLVLSGLGAAIGLAIGAAILRVAPSVIPADLLPAAVTLSFNLRVLTFCLVTALLVGLIVGLAPAWHATDLSPVQVMASGSRTATGRGRRMRTWLVVGQVATAVVLLFGAGLLLRTVVNLETIERGYHAESALTMIVDPPGWTPEALLRFYDTVARETEARPGVRRVAWASTLPLGRSYQGESFFQIVGDPPKAENRRPTADYQIVSPTYFETLDLPIVTGRGFDDRDSRDGLPVCMVNEAFVRGHLRGRSPIGVRVAIQPTSAGQAPAAVREIVGVVRQVKGRPDEKEDLLQIYVPLAQDTAGDIFMIVRPASGSARTLSSTVRGVFAAVDKAQVVSVRSQMTLEDVAFDATARYRFRAVLVITFAALALLLAMIGVFGVLAHSVEQRVREVGVRRALGATTPDVLRLVVANTVRMIAIGTAIGLTVSIGFGRWLAAMLFGVQPLDAMTFVSVLILLGVTAAVAIAVPARRVVRIDPVAALRSE